MMKLSEISDEQEKSYQPPKPIIYDYALNDGYYETVLSKFVGE